MSLPILPPPVNKLLLNVYRSTSTKLYPLKPDISGTNITRILGENRKPLGLPSGIAFSQTSSCQSPFQPIFLFFFSLLRCIHFLLKPIFALAWRVQVVQTNAVFCNGTTVCMKWTVTTWNSLGLGESERVIFVPRNCELIFPTVLFSSSHLFTTILVSVWCLENRLKYSDTHNPYYQAKPVNRPACIGLYAVRLPEKYPELTRKILREELIISKYSGFHGLSIVWKDI